MSKQEYQYLQVCEEEGDEAIELPTEEDGTLLLTTLIGQYPGSTGLKFRNPTTKTLRGIRLVDGRLHPPEGGWGDTIYSCAFPKENKRKSDDVLENSSAKTKRVESKLKCTDLIVLGLPWRTNDENLREYFEKFGVVLIAQVKKDPKSGQSKGFGFVRFSSYEAQMRVLAMRHMIDGRWCDVKIPNSKEGMFPPKPCKVFVGRCTEDLTSEDLREYFTKFGEVTDVFIPKPFRAFAFVTFLDPEVAQSLCGEDHIVNGVSLNVCNAVPKSENSNSQRSGGGGYNQRGGNSSMQQRSNDSMYGGNGGGPNNGMSNNGMSSSSSSYNSPIWNSGPRNNIDMPNLQALGITGNGNSRIGTPSQNLPNQSTNVPNPLGNIGLNFMNPGIVAALNQAGITGNGNPGAGTPSQNLSNQSTNLPNPLSNIGLNNLMNPAVVAALNQAGWGLINNMQNPPQDNFNQNFQTPQSNGNHSSPVKQDWIAQAQQGNGPNSNPQWARSQS